MKIEVALDDVSMQEALSLIESIKESIDIIEVGTPFLMRYGISAVKDMAARFASPAIEVLADTKIMDGGYLEASMAYEAGAKYATVLGATDNATITECIHAAQEYHGLLVVDMVCVPNLVERAKECLELGANIIAVHTGVDQQAQGRTPLGDLKMLAQALPEALISVAGGINAKTAANYAAYNPHIIVVGGGICHADDPTRASRQLRDALPR